MIRNLVITIVTALMIGGAGMSCTEDIPDCPTQLCVIAGGWKLVEVRLDGVMYDQGLNNFRLILHDPSTASENMSTFERTSVTNNQDDGIWSIENMNPDSSTPFKGGILRLVPGNNPSLREDWNIESFTPRQMVLVLNRDLTAKDGPAVIRFVLEPF